MNNSSISLKQNIPSEIYTGKWRGGHIQGIAVNDSIGRSILNAMGMESVKDAFYVAIFDGEKITAPDMNAETEGVMTTVWLKEVVEDYQAQWEEDGKVMEHRYGCSGIDGMTFAPAFDGKGWQLY